jgi:hypothetical protein
VLWSVVAVKSRKLAIHFSWKQNLSAEDGSFWVLAPLPNTTSYSFAKVVTSRRIPSERVNEVPRSHLVSAACGCFLRKEDVLRRASGGWFPTFNASTNVSTPVKDGEFHKQWSPVIGLRWRGNGMVVMCSSQHSSPTAVWKVRGLVAVRWFYAKGGMKA